MAELRLDRHCASFDINLRRSELYVLGKEDVYYKYDLTEVLSELDLFPE